MAFFYSRLIFSILLGLINILTCTEQCCGQAIVSKTDVHSISIIAQTLFKPRKQTVSLTHAYLSTLLLMYDIEPNPGPRTPKFPCGDCALAVTNNHAAISCDECTRWFHIACQGMSQATYANIVSNANDFSWICTTCTLAAYDVSALNLSRTSISTMDSDPPGSPLANSSLMTDSRKCGNQRTLSIINVNCQSISNKKGDMLDLIETYNPDIICGTETWLTKEHKDGELCIGFLGQYDLFRRDRTDRQGGGVLIAAKKDLQAQLQTQLESQCENIWIPISLHRAKTLYIGCYYRPNAQDNTSCGALAESLNRIPTHSIIIAGDFNYPDMDWHTKTVTSHTNRRLHEEFIDLIDDYSLKQLVDIPTRQGNILDLVLSNAS